MDDVKGQFLKLSTVAKMLDASKPYVRKLIDNKILPAFMRDKVIVIRREDYDKYAATLPKRI